MLHVLRIEDHPADVLLVREALRQSSLPADVLIAYDGEEAVKLLEELSFKPDFVIKVPCLRMGKWLGRQHSVHFHLSLQFRPPST